MCVMPKASRCNRRRVTDCVNGDDLRVSRIHDRDDALPTLRRGGRCASRVAIRVFFVVGCARPAAASAMPSTKKTGTSLW